ncbi:MULTISPECIES: response regulator [unclassified Streptomyces]|uniref:response regulator n=1 Tax=unclassified Streptomyces TaxID=2593676 RepID=UPI000A5752C2|nr:MULTISPECIES: response regulator transcription factor [unclassified Streptomyces]MCP3769895.1 response regulator transcription factor [Streptomyces sp. MAR25Y5]
MSTPAAPGVRICLADDHTLMRDGLKEVLRTATGFAVVGEASTGTEAVVLVARLRPDVLLLDIEMPGPQASETIRHLARIAPETRVLVLTMHDDPDMVHKLLAAGASGYLLKSILRDELIAAVRSACQPSDSVVLVVSRRTVEQLHRQKPPPLKKQLTERELVLLHLVAEALSNAQIAARLFITEATVKRHLTNIYAKLDAVSRVDALRKATAAGLIGSERAGPTRDFLSVPVGDSGS